MQDVIYTIGHSNHTEEHFLRLLDVNQVTAVADVRSTPHSRYNPHFNREELQAALKQNNIGYAFLGRELGARSDDPGCYLNGKVQYDRLAQSPTFQQGISRLRKGMAAHRVAILCAEKEPLECHRTILVARHLRAINIVVRHILEDGLYEDHEETLGRLYMLLRLRESEGHLFRKPEDLLADAYRLQEARIAYEQEVQHDTSASQPVA